MPKMINILGKGIRNLLFCRMWLINLELNYLQLTVVYMM
jgi:hypothetical protein